MNYPFADMLGEEVNRNLIIEQLKNNISNLIANKVSFAAIACNTLYGFLPSKIEGGILVHIIEETKRYLDEKNWKTPLI
ncbi:MAG: hypothetical protein H0U49_01690 [Parachlamydiaceae bacterium]|nr:hypothetical protein [Parachlamydiaceae bacterium]